MEKLKAVLGTKYPIIVGPMAWISTAPLVAAVANAGALGVLGVGFAPNNVVLDQIQHTKLPTDKPFAINVTISRQAESNLERVTEIAINNKIQFIYADNFEGLDKNLTQKWFSKWHRNGIKVITKVSTAEEAAIADQCDADVIIAKGWEGGGHMTKVGTMALLPTVVDATKKAVVVASGGIADGRGYAAARMLGASGIEMGTAFLPVLEGDFHSNAKKAVLSATTENLVMTGYSTGAPCWQIQNNLSERLNTIERENSPVQAASKVANLASGSIRVAAQEGDTQNKGAVMPGQVVTLVTKEKSVAQTLEDVYNQGIKILKSAANLDELQ
ncbi:MAG TPA: hypothetical protein DCW31_07315 [Lactobacillus sp.]|nr:hypothetical protein [Lactobacillus sp.]